LLVLEFEFMSSRNEPKFSALECSFARALAIVGDSWTLLILREAIRGECCFEGFQRELGVPAASLTDRLDRLTADGLMEIRPSRSRVGCREYQLTEKGRDLHVTLVALNQWGDRWISGPGHEPFILTSRNTGAPLAPLAMRDVNDVFVAPGDVALAPGPGASARLLRKLGGHLEPKRLARVLDFVETNLGAEISIDALASIACLSRFHFARAFRTNTGRTPQQYVTARRMERAKAMLADTHRPIGEIALQLSFANLSSFSRAFREATGFTPSQYRDGRRNQSVEAEPVCKSSESEEESRDGSERKASHVRCQSNS
jgi:AraC-like DNA-binding protein/DNA-binding HxlR family transcriptional regulator